jgi:site-specific recombinase XerD
MEYYMTNWQSQLQRLEGAYAPNTLRSYYADVGEFVDWCDQGGRQAFRSLTTRSTAYLAHMEQRLSFSSIRRKLSSVKRMQSLLGHGKHTHGEDFAIAYRRMRRGKTMSQRQAKGINEELLLRAIAAQPNTITGIRNAALLSVGYDFLARRSELTSLQVSDIKF